MSSRQTDTPRPAEGWVDIRDLKVRYLDWGGEGTPIMALHGLASSGHWYDLVAEHLGQHHRIIAPDQRGHGQTTQAPGGYDGESLAADIVGLMDHLEISQAAVLGHSWGANVAAFVAAYAPERVTALVLIDGGTGRRTPEDGTWEERRSRIRPRDVTGTREQFLDRLRQQLHFCWNDDVERIVQTMVYEDEAGQIQDILRPETHIQIMQSMWEEPASNAWSRIACPTLIIPATTPSHIPTPRPYQRQRPSPMSKPRPRPIFNSPRPITGWPSRAITAPTAKR